MRRRAAFTIVELSIVLTVIALITGGILMAKSLIREGELQNIIAERTQYANAIFAFRDKYKSWPGDIADAYDYWGSTCGANSTDRFAGCNGDGNGLIQYAPAGENVKAWEHLWLAGLVVVQASGTGADNGANGVWLTKANTIASKFPDANWDFSTDATSMVGDTSAVVKLHLGRIVSSQSRLTYLSVLTNGNALSIDTKIDDGQSSKGTMNGNNDRNCYDISDDYYAVRATGESATGNCVLHFSFR